VLYRKIGTASWYGAYHQGRLTASGARFDMNGLTAAHRSLPLATTARVTNLANGRTVTVTINDRGPYWHGRIIDLSARAAQLLGMKRQGTARVKIEVLASDQPGAVPRAMAAAIE
jgi:rare lipoprotein A